MKWVFSFFCFGTNRQSKVPPIRPSSRRPQSTWEETSTSTGPAEGGSTGVPIGVTLLLGRRLRRRLSPRLSLWTCSEDFLPCAYFEEKFGERFDITRPDWSDTTP